MRSLAALIVLAIVAGGSLAGCSDTVEPPLGTTTVLDAHALSTLVTNPFGTIDYAKRTLANFQRIEKGMSLEDVVALVGAPDADVGSGLWILLYEIEDGSTVTVTLGVGVIGVVRDGEALIE